VSFFQWFGEEARRICGRIVPHPEAGREFLVEQRPAGVAGLITPWNFPLAQGAKKIAAAVAAGCAAVWKPAEATPLVALALGPLAAEAGLPPGVLQIVPGDGGTIGGVLAAHPAVRVLSLTGSTATGRAVMTAAAAGIKRVALELGGNSPLLVLADADLDLAARLAAEGCFRNSGQRCTAIRRLLVDRRVLAPFTERLLAAAKDYPAGDPTDEATRVGTVIDARSAERLEAAVREAESRGAKVLRGGRRRGALMEPTVLSEVPRDALMARQECFGPLAPILAVDGLEDALALANATDYGLSSGVVTTSLESAVKAVKGIRAGTVNVNEVPGYRLESTPFGGVKDSGLGIKEGVVEAMRFMTTVKTYSLPW